VRPGRPLPRRAERRRATPRQAVYVILLLLLTAQLRGFHSLRCQRRRKCLASGLADSYSFPSVETKRPARMSPHTPVLRARATTVALLAFTYTQNGDRPPARRPARPPDGARGLPAWYVAEDISFVFRLSSKRQTCGVIMKGHREVYRPHVISIDRNCDVSQLQVGMQVYRWVSAGNVELGPRSSAPHGLHSCTLWSSSLAVRLVRL